MIPYQSALSVWIFIEISKSFSYYYGNRNRKLSPSSKLRTDSLRGCDVKICLQKKRIKFEKWRQKDTILKKNIEKKDTVLVRTEEIACSFPTNIGL